MTGLAPEPRAALVQAVQTNCHIADARHAPDLSLCIYLLQMREFFRWEHGSHFGAALDRQAVGTWLARRELLWSELEARPFVALPLGGRRFDPLDADALNVELAPLGLVYGAGLASADRPAFFIAQLDRLLRRDDALVVQVCGREYARGLFAPPAALRGATIVLRRESLARWLWEKFEAFSLRGADGPFKALVDAYGLDGKDAFVAALPRLVDDQSETLLLHESGEYQVGQSLGPGWARMRLALGPCRTDLYVRAVRDQWVDLELTLPVLVDRAATTALHFWFANYEGLREQMFPGLVDGYRAWRGGDGGRTLRRAAQVGGAHFRALAQQVMALHTQLGDRAGPAIGRLLTAPESVCARPA